MESEDAWAPATPSTDHSREYIPIIVYKKGIEAKNLHIRESYTDVAATVLDYLGVNAEFDHEFIGKSLL